MSPDPSAARAVLLAGVTLAVAAPFFGIAAWRARTHERGLAVFVAVLVALDAFLMELPRVGPFRHLHWGWQECALTLAWPFLLVALAPGITAVSIGVTSRFRSGWIRPCLFAGAVAVAVPGVFFLLGARRHLTAEGWIFLSTMPGLAEEVAFRGAIQSLLNRAFGRPWRLAGADLGWGLVITAVLFAGFNGLVSVDDRLHVQIVLQAAIAPFLSGLVSGWVRERTDSIWMCVVGHNLSNLVIPLSSLST